MTGALKQIGCVRSVRTCISAGALGGAAGLAITPDGKKAYVAAPDADAVSEFARDADTGTLSFIGCVSDDGTDRMCVTGNALRGADAIATSLDGKNVYVAADNSNAVLTFARDATTIPQMFAQVSQGKMSAADSVRATGNELQQIWKKWKI